MTFYAWLSRQTARTDETGVFARYAVKDKIFPRKGKRLYLFLLRYEGMPEQRKTVKRVHAEWRKARRLQAAA